MKLFAGTVLLCSSACSSLSSAPPGVAASVPAFAQAPAAHVPPSTALDQRFSIYLGQRSLEDSDWDPVEDQGLIGFEYARENRADPFGWEVGLMASRDETRVLGSDAEGSTGELYGGLRKSFGDEAVHPYFGGGLALIRAKVDVPGVGDEDDDSLGAYVHGGVDFDVSESFILGLDLRVLFGSEIDFAGFDGDVDYEQLALRLGWRF